MSRLPNPRQVAKNLVYAVTGGGGAFLRHKQEYHRLRAAAERQVLAEAATTPGLLVANVCPACGGAAVASRFSNPVGFSFAICADDGCVYMDPVPTDATLARLYNDPSYAFEGLHGQPVDEVRPQPSHAGDLEALLRLLGRERGGGRLLDVGCSTGGFLMSAAAVGFDAEGVELGDTMAAVARRSGLRVTTGRLEDLPGAAAFDVITMLQLVEHVVRPAALLAAARRLLAPGGAIYVNTPNIESASFAYLGRRHVHVASFGHVSLLGRRALDRVATAAGLVVTAHELWGGRDVALHDLVAMRVGGDRFYHRMALYEPRLYHACNLVDQLTLGAVTGALVPGGAESYQRALLRRAP